MMGGFLVNALINLRFFFRRESFSAVVISKGLFLVKPGAGRLARRLVSDVEGCVMGIAEIRSISRGSSTDLLS